MVAIKDMDMPKGCLDCDFFEGENTYCDGDVLIPYGFFRDGRENNKHPDCPLIEIEEHKIEKLDKIEQIVNEQVIIPEGVYPKLKKIKEILEKE